MDLPNKYRILLVEDDLADQLAFKRAVKMGEINYDFSIAVSIEDALEQLKDGHYDLIVTDYFLGDGTAFDIMKTKPDVPLIFVTGGGDEELAVKAMREGAYDYLIKDPDYQYLKLLPVTVENAIGHHTSGKKLEESERRYRELFEGTSDLIQIFNANGKLLYVNGAWRKSLCYSEDEVGEMSFFDIVSPDFREDCRTMLNGLLQGEELSLMQTEFVTQKGKRMTVRGNLSVSRSNGDLTVRGIFHDVSAQIQVEQMLKRSNEELEQVVAERTGELAAMNDNLVREIEKQKITEYQLKAINEELNTFIYKTSHDIRGPLTSILGLVNVAKLEQEKETLQHYFNLVEDRMQHLDDILRDLIDVSKIKQGVLERTRIDFDHLIDDILKSLQHLPLFERLKVSKHVESDLNFHADPHVMRTIFHNLTVNAIKYQRTEADQPEFCISVSTRENMLIIEAKDNGIGIESEVCDRVFDMFYRATNQSEGSGLGLYIVKKAVSKLNGVILLESELGIGSKFTIRIPFGERKEPVAENNA